MILHGLHYQLSFCFPFSVCAEEMDTRDVGYGRMNIRRDGKKNEFISTKDK